LRTAGRSFENEEILGWANIEKKFAKGARQRRERGSFFRERSGRLVTRLRFYEAQLLQIARKSGLGDTELLRGEAAAQFLLIGNPLIANQAEDLTVPECFSCVHKERTLDPYVFLYSGLHTPVNPFWAIFCRLQPGGEKAKTNRTMYDSQHAWEAHWIFRTGDVTYLLGQYHRSHGNALPDFGLQE
jgi:hypothetical protein